MESDDIELYCRCFTSAGFQRESVCNTAIGAECNRTSEPERDGPDAGFTGGQPDRRDGSHTATATTAATKCKQ